MTAYETDLLVQWFLHPRTHPAVIEQLRKELAARKVDICSPQWRPYRGQT